MAIGKREQIVGLSIAVLGAIFLIHILIFGPKANEFAEVQAQFDQGRAQLEGVETVPSPNFLAKEDAKTAEYRDKLSSVTSQLNTHVPDYFKEDKPENFQKRLDEMLASLRELSKLRDAGKPTKLTFLGDRRMPQNPYVQLGWNLPSRLPIFEQVREQNQARARLWDLITQLENHWTVANNISDPETRMQYRSKYNEYLMQLGLNPIELSDFYYQAAPSTPLIFFNDKKTYEQLGNTKAFINKDYSINRYGVFLPDIKRMWMLELIWAEKDQNTRITRDKLHQVLEIKLPFAQQMMFLNKQLAALVDMARMAGKANVQEITQVHMLKPADFVKLERREPGKKPPAPTPTPAAQANAMGGGEFGAGMMDMGMGGMGTPVPTPAGDKVAKGAGLEVYFTATNPSTFDFLFDVATLPRTYALDDLYIYAMQGNTLYTTATVELIMKLEAGGANGEAGAAAAPAGGAAPAAPADPAGMPPV